MKWRNCQLDNTVSKANEDLTLWQTERGMIRIGKNTLACPIRLDDQQEGYLFHGHYRLLLDTIVETNEGATGKPLEKETNTPFLMLGNTERLRQHFSTADEDDFLGNGLEVNKQGFIAKAEDLLNRFLEKERMKSHCHFREDDSSIFAFQNENNRLDILVAEGSKLVYKTEDTLFVSNGNKVVLKSLGQVVCASDGKSVIGKR